jgi:hypothetical protein
MCAAKKKNERKKEINNKIKAIILFLHLLQVFAAN